MKIKKHVSMLMCFLILLFGLRALAAFAQPAPATPVPRCPVPNQLPRFKHYVPPRFPASLHGVMGVVEVVVEVIVDAHGGLTGAWVYKSSGNSDVDAAALQSAKASTYLPGRSNCVAASAPLLLHSLYNGAPLRAPTITMPSGWVPDPARSLKGTRIAWSDGANHYLVLTWHTESRTLAEVRTDVIRRNELRQPETVQAVRLCNGTQDGIRFIRGSPGEGYPPSGTLEMILANDVLYTALFTGPDATQPSPAVTKALDSFCTPPVTQG